MLTALITLRSLLSDFSERFTRMLKIARGLIASGHSHAKRTPTFLGGFRVML
ncbi:hypothetical protein [Tardiphaga sp. 862_B3_N1_1]|uniref:hypothetical protein n=1 Tax=Tardiphaga sp. 862_B3_N1_1 TaxID=3240763 RepID=UPI003F8CBDD4